MTEQSCAFCGKPAESGATMRGCLIFGLTADDTEVWYHRLCSVEAEREARLAA